MSDLEKWQQEVVDLLTIMWAVVRDHDCDDCRELYESTQARIDELVPPSAPAIEPPPGDLAEKLVSPHAFDGRGPVPEKVKEAAKRIAHLRVKFVNQWNPAAENPLTAREVQQLFDAAAVQAEWMRELYEAVHEPPPGDRLRELIDAAGDFLDGTMRPGFYIGGNDMAVLLQRMRSAHNAVVVAEPLGDER